ncbi:uncharacterized protein PITG_18227 [Phytophthora infestans T30-4]|uniref:RxLR effector protein n=1 Tax=Phytophthora infestans (strain T30-4) TaxID=403677 RepID=D0NXN0_PHYIT|nr:uncharacterized protein PITG_18227 [Phytophthora infestans T30-4]EEY67830.1 conserved hypothetical protein [Phytophthora infestans T30-4]|eukprot:XP_002997855.1 conserved hypothetical protein [Phytophthora infestans T30-4]
MKAQIRSALVITEAIETMVLFFNYLLAPQYQIKTTHLLQMRVSCVLVAAAAIAVLTNSCGAAPTSIRAPEVSTDTVSDVRVFPGTKQHDRKTLLRSELEDENEDSEDDEDNEDNEERKFGANLFNAPNLDKFVGLP